MVYSYRPGELHTRAHSCAMATQPIAQYAMLSKGIKLHSEPLLERDQELSMIYALSITGFEYKFLHLSPSGLINSLPVLKDLEVCDKGEKILQVRTDSLWPGTNT